MASRPSSGALEPIVNVDIGPQSELVVRTEKVQDAVASAFPPCLRAHSNFVWALPCEAARQELERTSYTRKARPRRAILS